MANPLAAISNGVGDSDTFSPASTLSIRGVAMQVVNVVRASLEAVTFILVQTLEASGVLEGLGSSVPGTGTSFYSAKVSDAFAYAAHRCPRLVIPPAQCE
jgi:hypothetical protein